MSTFRLQKTVRSLLLTGAVLAAGGVGPVALASPGALTVEGAVELALRTNPRLAAARERLRANQETAIGVGRRLLPAIRVNDELQRYDSPFVVSFPDPTGAMGLSLRARDQTTNTFVASVDQPVLGLLRLDQERRAESESSAGAAARLAALEADVRRAVETDFLRFFEAQAMEKIADTAASELDAQAVVARARLASGVINRVDVLRIEVATANARQQALQAHSQAESARAGLRADLGLDARDGELALVEPEALLAAARSKPAPASELLSGARTRRPELIERLHLAQAAAFGARARGFALLPELDLEAAYLRVDGQVFTPKNSAFVGVKAQWGIWEWGATEHQRRAAEAQSAAAARDAEATEREIEAEVMTTLSQGDSARGAVDAAEHAIAGAEEAFRVTQAQLKAGAATTTDLLESQAALTQARLNLTRAQYELALARVGLSRAAGL